MSFLSRPSCGWVYSTADMQASKTHELTTLQSSLASAKSRLVQSPDRIKKHISEMTYTVAQERASLQAHQRKARELAHRLEVIGGMEVDVKGLIDLEKGIEIQRLRVEEARRNVISLKGKIEGTDIEVKSLDAKLSVSLSSAHSPRNNQS
jgi:kinetochore protein Nuf2